MPISDAELKLTVLITVVGGAQSVRSNLSALCPQVNFDVTEVIVPYDNWSKEVGGLTLEFPKVRFHFADDLGFADPAGVRATDHRLYDRRRAVGLRLSKGGIVAMTEDCAVPAGDWVDQLLRVHEQPYEAIGGAIENGVERPLNRALYYCDFGRYGRPLRNGEVSYVSDVNIAYKRAALTATQELWRDAYHETTVNWALQAQGKKLLLDDRPVVFQRRPHLRFWGAIRERFQWGRIFAETRAGSILSHRRYFFAAGTILLPFLLFLRAYRNMRRQKLSFGKTFSTLPIVSLLVVVWSFGEFVGYLTSGSGANHEPAKTVKVKEVCP